MRQRRDSNASLKDHSSWTVSARALIRGRLAPLFLRLRCPLKPHRLSLALLLAEESSVSSRSMVSTGIVGDMFQRGW